MTDLLLFNGFSLLAQGPTLTHEVRSGELVSVVGPPSSGKSRLLSILMGAARPGQGNIDGRGHACQAGREGFARRATPLAVARRIVGTSQVDTAAAALTSLGLWDVRQSQISQLSDAQQHLCELIPLLVSNDPVLVLDGHLDTLDPWTLARVLPALFERLSRGSCAFVVSSRPDILRLSTWLLVLVDQRIRFAGSPADLIRMHAPTEIEVVTQKQVGVRALVEPFQVSIRETPEGLYMQAAEGQALASKLLLEGYGDIQMLIQRTPKLEEALLKITR